MGIYPEKELMDSYFVVKVFQVFAQIYLAIIPLDFGPVKGLYIRDVFINNYLKIKKVDIKTVESFVCRDSQKISWFVQRLIESK